MRSLNLLLVGSTAAQQGIHWFHTKGGCATPLGSSGQYDERWQVTEIACRDECARMIDCLAYEFGQVGNYNLCELHKEVLAKTFPGEHGITCHVKDSDRNRAAWMGLFDAPNQVVQATVAAPQTHTSARADCTAATAKGLKDLTALPGKPGDLRGCIFNDVDMSGGVVMEGVEFDWSSFQRAILQDAKANGASFRHAMMAGVVLSKGSFEGADFWRADLSEAQLESTTCSRCEFEWAILVRARMAGAVLQDAKLGYATLQGADLQNADLTRVDFSLANLGGVTLKGAKFSGADVRGVSFKGADTTGCDFAGVVNMHKARCDGHPTGGQAVTRWGIQAGCDINNPPTRGYAP
mmetsp:Transcript_43336/g.139160  ORF Transcript_43336/g.139160 Transcript_43336/m.139160 type:complete len:351 (-) Transcript_43336:138-1190(-)